METAKLNEYRYKRKVDELTDEVSHLRGRLSKREDAIKALEVQSFAYENKMTKMQQEFN